MSDKIGAKWFRITYDRHEGFSYSAGEFSPRFGHNPIPFEAEALEGCFRKLQDPIFAAQMRAFVRDSIPWIRATDRRPSSGTRVDLSRDGKTCLDTLFWIDDAGWNLEGLYWREASMHNEVKLETPEKA